MEYVFVGDEGPISSKMQSQNDDLHTFPMHEMSGFFIKPEQSATVECRHAEVSDAVTESHAHFCEVSKSVHQKVAVNMSVVGAVDVKAMEQ